MAVRGSSVSILALAVALWLPACGGDDQIASHSSKLLGGTGTLGTIDLSSVSSFWPPTNWQSETAGVSDNGLGYEYLAFNAEDTSPGHISYMNVMGTDGRTYQDRVICPGTNMMGVNIDDPSSDGWQAATHPAMPSGTAVLFTDPAIAMYNGRVWISAPAAPSDFFASKANFNGCFRTSLAPRSSFPSSYTALAGACLVSAVIGTRNFDMSQCFRRQGGAVSASGTDFFDGGSIAVSPDGETMYVGYKDNFSAAIYKSTLGGTFTALPNPPLTITSHVKLAALDGAVYMVAPQANTSTTNQLWYARYNDHWTVAPNPIATDFARPDKDITLTDGVTKLRDVGFAAQLLPNDDNPAVPLKIAVFYQKKTGTSPRTRLQGIICDPFTMACTSPTGLVTSSTSDAFNPAIATALKRVTGQTFLQQTNAVSFWSDQGRTDGSIHLSYATFTLSGSMTPHDGITQNQKPCVMGTTDPYWGDYDNMHLIFNFTAGPYFVRPFTDSTAVACDPNANKFFRAADQHVSAVYFPSP
jgi:hypothetical protein